MKKTYNSSKIDKALNTCIYADTLRSLQVPLFLIEYESGESVSNYNYFQIVIHGNISISFVRDDGSAYSLSNGGKNYIFGEMDLFAVSSDNIVAEAASSLLTVAVDAASYKDKLLNNADFLQLIAATLANKIRSITNTDAAPSSLSERILNYMKFKCDNHILSGIEKTAFRLHCSPRQLQRILNQFEKDNIVTKIGKGRYIENGFSEKKTTD